MENKLTSIKFASYLIGIAISATSKKSANEALVLIATFYLIYAPTHQGQINLPTVMENQMTTPKKNVITESIREIIKEKLDAGEIVAKIARDLKLPDSTVRGITRKYHLTGNIMPSPRPGRATILNDSDREKIKEIVATNPTVTMDELRDNFQKSVCRSTMYNEVKKLNLSFKCLSLVPNRRNAADVIKKRIEYCKIEIDGSEAIFIDETGINRAMRPRKGWGKKGHRINIPIPEVKSPNISVICAISVHHIISYKFHTGGTNRECFMEYLMELFKIIKGQNKLLIMDNASIHKGEDIRRLIMSNGHRVLYLPPYSPFLNPIEEMFGKFKHYLRRGLIRSLNIQNAIHHGFGMISAEDLLNFFMHSYSYYQLCLEGKPILK